MRNSKTLARIRSGGLARCCSLGHYIPAYVSLAARSGFDCIWLDLEHRAFDTREIQALMALIRAFDIDCMVRAPTLEKTGLYRYLEEGATGLMIPHVSTPEMAEALVRASKFPPVGDRGLDNSGLDSGFRETTNFEAYVEWANRETFLTVQIETPEAVANAGAIAAVPGVDMLFIGPGDLGLRLRQAGDADGSRLEAAFQTVADAAKKHGKAWACPVGNADELKRRREQGASFLANGGDFLMLQHGLEELARQFEAAGA
ncbi:MAG: 4-hydroxy-2-oxovalerate aldolase [Akkermansiaceae bacterium]|nr:4-hydroxy-2-oxovalerate aldolase [Akkermansiaceae bacterium]